MFTVIVCDRVRGSPNRWMCVRLRMNEHVCPPPYLLNYLFNMRAHQQPTNGAGWGTRMPERPWFTVTIRRLCFSCGNLCRLFELRPNFIYGSSWTPQMDGITAYSFCLDKSQAWKNHKSDSERNHAWFARTLKKTMISKPSLLFLSSQAAFFSSQATSISFSVHRAHAHTLTYQKYLRRSQWKMLMCAVSLAFTPIRWILYFKISSCVRAIHIWILFLSMQLWA